MSEVEDGKTAADPALVEAAAPDANVAPAPEAAAAKAEEAKEEAKADTAPTNDPDPIKAEVAK